jgi:hypothetical protein
MGRHRILGVHFTTNLFGLLYNMYPAKLRKTKKQKFKYPAKQDRAEENS